ncbi:hypothetical protein PYCC9005_002220 [Savitreella phatthalungensis]
MTVDDNRPWHKRRRQDHDGEEESRPSLGGQKDFESAHTASLPNASGFGARMLAKMGYKPGQGLGANATGITQPIQAAVRHRTSAGLGEEQEERPREASQKARSHQKPQSLQLPHSDDVPRELSTLASMANEDDRQAVMIIADASEKLDALKDARTMLHTLVSDMRRIDSYLERATKRQRDLLVALEDAQSINNLDAEDTELADSLQLATYAEVFARQLAEWDVESNPTWTPTLDGLTPEVRTILLRKLWLPKMRLVFDHPWDAITAQTGLVVLHYWQPMLGPVESDFYTFVCEDRLLAAAGEWILSDDKHGKAARWLLEWDKMLGRNHSLHHLLTKRIEAAMETWNIAHGPDWLAEVLEDSGFEQAFERAIARYVSNLDPLGAFDEMRALQPWQNFVDVSAAIDELFLPRWHAELVRLLRTQKGALVADWLERWIAVAPNKSRLGMVGLAQVRARVESPAINSALRHEEGTARQLLDVWCNDKGVLIQSHHDRRLLILSNGNRSATIQLAREQLRDMHGSLFSFRALAEALDV